MTPEVVIHVAVSLDGKTTGFEADQESYYSIAAQMGYDCALAGSETMFDPPVEIPTETEEAFEPIPVQPNDTRPILAVPDSRGKLRNWHFWKTLPFCSDFVALVSETTPSEYLEYLDRRYIKHITSGKDKVDLPMALEKLNEQFSTKRVRIDSGGALNAVAMEAGLVTEVSLMVHPVMVGTKRGGYFIPAELDKNQELKLKEVKQLDNGIVWMWYTV